MENYEPKAKPETDHVPQTIGVKGSQASSCNSELLGVGDTVLITKPTEIDRRQQFGWCLDMDEHDGCVSSIRRVLPKKDRAIQAYDLNIDGGEFGWLETWLTKVDA